MMLSCIGGAAGWFVRSLCARRVMFDHCGARTGRRRMARPASAVVEVRDALLGESQREPSGFSALRPRMVFAGGLLSQGLGDRPQSKLPDCTRGISDKRHGATCRFPSARLVFVSFNCIAQVASFLQVSKSTSSIRHAMLSRVGQRWKCRSGEKAGQARQQSAVSRRAIQHDHVTRSLRGGVVRVCPWCPRAGTAIDLSRIVTFPSTAKAHRLVALGQRKLDSAPGSVTRPFVRRVLPARPARDGNRRSGRSP